MNVLITELMWEDGITILNDARFTVDYQPELVHDREKLLNIIPAYDALIVRNQTIVDEELLNKASKLKAVGRLGVGLDNINVESLRERKISLIVPRNANATSVAEFVIGAMMDATRNISEASRSVKNGNWDRKLFTGEELSGKTLGLFGLGEIANRVVKRANAFAINVIGFDPFVGENDYIVAENGVKLFSSLEELLSKSDFVSIHVPLTPETKNVFHEDMFSVMKSNAVIINSSRGGIINEHDLVSAIKTNQIRGAYLDVLEVEPVQADSPLLEVEQIKITPHIAGLTEQSQERISTSVASEIVKVLQKLQTV